MQLSSVAAWRLRGIVLAVGLGVAVVTPRAEIIEQVLVKVNGEIFTKTDLEQRQVSALRQKNRGLTEADLRNDTQLKAALAEVTPQLIADAVDELLLLQRGRELGFRLSDEQFSQIVQNIRKENKLESDEQFQAALRQEGMTVDDLRRNIERSMVIQRVQQQDVMDKISITEAESAAYYEAHKQEFTTPANVTLREILVAVPDKAPEGAPGAGQSGVNVGLDEEAKAKAVALRARAVAGEDFTALVASASDGPSKANGGLIGPINRDELTPALQKLVDTLKPGEVSEPVRGSRGYQIFKLESKSTTVILPLDQVRNQVADRVFREKGRPELERYLKRLREQAIIEWKNDEIKRLYEEYISKPAAATSSGNS
jgi:peptidyl-prolyl cis-trans isomerase SurA